MLCNGLSQFKQLLLDFFNIPEFIIDISLMYTAHRFSTTTTTNNNDRLTAFDPGQPG